MAKNSKWQLVRLVLAAAGIAFLAFHILILVLMSWPVVTQSNGFTPITPEAREATLCKSLPATATHVRYCHVSVGMGGRLLAYRFSAPTADLHQHAAQEFAAHWDQPAFNKSVSSPPPNTADDLSALSRNYRVDLEWMLPNPGTSGTTYMPADGPSSHRPLIFVDESQGILYFLMTD